MTKRTAFVIAPGRGSYQSSELGYLTRFHAAKKGYLEALDAFREMAGQTPLSVLDQADRFVLSRHVNGENASLLTAACALGDFADIDQDRFDIVAIAGNSMGWYLSLAAAGALPDEAGWTLINTMGTLMHEKGVGGQILYPVVDEHWQPDPARQDHIATALDEASSAGLRPYISIRLGGTVVLAGSDETITFLKNHLPTHDRYPMVLSHHAAFHTPLLSFLIPEAKGKLPISLFRQPKFPMIDGEGTIWNPGATHLEKLYQYTLGRQIDTIYNFSKSVEVGLKEFAPDCVIILGPGSTMGAPVIQTMIDLNWFDLTSKDSFKTRQVHDPVVFSMGIEAQRIAVTR